MSDARLRALQRIALTDPSPEARAAVLRERLRVGTLTRERVELAAYCGDPGAAMTYVLQDLDSIGRALAPKLGDWVSGLPRWDHDVLVRAAVAAARVAADCTRIRSAKNATHMERSHGSVAADRAVEAAEAWLACPCGEHETAWRIACLYLHEQDWAPRPVYPPGRAAVTHEQSIKAAADLAGEAPVREAIQRALISWALGDA